MQTQHVNLDEGQETCSSSHDICFGKLSIYKFNFTTTANESISAVKLNLNKGCSSLQKLEGNFKAKNQRCWSTNISQHFDFDTYSDDGDEGSEIFNVTEIKKAFRLKGNVENVSNIFGQSDTCFCQTDLCNGTPASIVSNVSSLLAIAVLSVVIKIKLSLL